MTTPRIVVVGAGISGLAVAFQLQESLPDSAITVLEASARPGGTIWTERRSGFQVEVGANGFLDNRPHTLALCQRLGLSGQLVTASPAARHRFLFLGRHLQALPESLLGLVSSPLLGWRSKSSLLTERWRRSRPPTHEESVHGFVARRTTEEIAETFADALVTGIHAGDPKLLSASAAFPRLVQMEREQGSVLGGMKRLSRQRRAEAKARRQTVPTGSRLHSFRPGLRLLIETLAAKLRTPPRCESPVLGLRRDDASWHLDLGPTGTMPADVVVLACPVPAQARLLANFDPPLQVAMLGISYAAAAVVALGYRRADVSHPLDGFGYVMPQRLRGDVLGAQWCSSIFPDRAPPGHVLIRLIAGGWHRGDVVQWDEARLILACRKHLQLALDVAAEPTFRHVVRWERAIPQYHLGHAERVRGIEEGVARHQGLFVTGNAYHGVAMNDCIEQAGVVADAVVQHARAATR